MGNGNAQCSTGNAQSTNINTMRNLKKGISIPKPVDMGRTGHADENVNKVLSELGDSYNIQTVYEKTLQGIHTVYENLILYLNNKINNNKFRIPKYKVL